MESLKRVLVEHSFFEDLEEKEIETLAGCASNVKFDAFQFVFRERDPANAFYLIRQGKVALEIYHPIRGPITVETLEAGDVLGWSWLFPPYKWHFDARVLELTRAIAMDGECLRKKCSADNVLGYHMMTKFARIMQDRLQVTRLQLLDIYSEHTT